jgi:hypothetical protein
LTDGGIRSLQEASTTASRAAVNKKKRPAEGSTYGSWTAKRIDSGRGQPTAANISVVVDAAIFNEVKVDQPGDCVYLASSMGLLIARGTPVAVCNLRHQVSEELLHPERKVLYGWSSDQQLSYGLMADKMREMGVWSIDLNKQVLPALANVFTVTFVVWERVSLDPGKVSILRSFSPVGQPPVTASQVLLGGGQRTVIHLLGSPHHYDLLILKAGDPLIHGPRLETCVPAGRRGDSVQSNKAAREDMGHGGEGRGGGAVQSTVWMQHMNLETTPSVSDLAKAPVDPTSMTAHLKNGLAKVKESKTFLMGRNFAVPPANVLKDVDQIEGGISRLALLQARTETPDCCGACCIPNILRLDAHLAALNTKNETPRALFVQARLLEISRFPRGHNSRGQLAFIFMYHGDVICKEAYRRFHGMARRSFRRYRAQAADGHVMLKRTAKSRGVNALTSNKTRQQLSWKEQVIHAWLKRTLPRITEFNPTKCQISIQLETYEKLFERYTSYCDQHRLTDYNRGTKKDMNRVLMRGKWREIMTTRHNPDVGVCTLCQTYSTAMCKIDKGTNLSAYKELVAKKEAHRAEWEGRRNLAADLALSGAEMKKFAVFQTDGADSSKTMCPTLACHTKMEDVQALTLKLQGVALQGVGLWLFAIPEYLKSGANVLCTCLLLACQKAAVVLRDRGQSMPRKLVIEVDGGSENWNVTTLRFFCLLVHAGVYDVMELIRCPPGHGHNALDGVYGFLSQWLHGSRGKQPRSGRNVYTLRQYKAAAMECLEGSDIIDMVDVEFAWDFKKLLGEHILPDMQGHGANQRGDFTFGENVTWWKIHAHIGPGPTQTRGVYIQHKIGFQDNAVHSGWRPTDHSNKGFQVTGFDLLPPTPGYDDFDAAKLTEFKETKRDNIINQFITPAESDTVNMLSTHGREFPGSITEWRTYFDALPASADADAHVQALGKKENDAHVVPGYFLPSFERTPDSLTESESLGFDVRLSIQDAMKAALSVDPVTHNAAERKELNAKRTENSDILKRDGELAKMQVAALTEQQFGDLAKGDLVVLALVGQVLPFMVARVLENMTARSELKIQWYDVTNIKAAPIDKAALLASFTTAKFLPHEQVDVVPCDSVLLCHPKLNVDGKFSAAKIRPKGQRSGKAVSTVQEMVHLSELGVLCK